MEVEFKSEKGLEPSYENEGDLHDLRVSEDTVVPFRTTVAVKTSVEMRFDSSMTALVCSRSGLAKNESLAVLNGPGIIDPGYEGEIMVILHNHTGQDYRIKRGDRIAQIMFVKPERVTMKKVSSFDRGTSSTRGRKGLGSSGK